MTFSYPSHEQLAHIEQYDDPFPYPNVPVDKGACRLLGPTALVVQALMGGLVIASLVLKRQREKPMRPWRIWLFDVSKQILGQAFVHGLNIFISGYVAHLAEGNPCDLYFLNVLIDTTIGVGYIFLVLHGADKLFTDHLHLKGFRSGEYGDPPSIAFWGRQAAVYVFTILTMKLLVVALFAAWPGIFNIGEWLLGWTGENDRLQVVFVMGIFPIIMNVLQFWLIDSIVKASASMYAEENTRSTDDDSRQPLFRDPDIGDDDDGDDDTFRSQRRHDVESPPTPLQKSSQRTDSINENKSLASGSSSTLVDPSSINQHRYPPERATTAVDTYPSPTTPDSSSTAFSTSSLRSKKSKRRSPPPPIQRPPPLLSNSTQYVISATPSPTQSISSYTTSPSPSKTQPRQRHRSTLSIATVPGEPVEQEWDNWVERSDWAEKVGEEDWTGRRIGVTKAALDNWGGKVSGTSLGVPVS